LDIDFDVLFSDPAPIEALLQRFGRVNRGRRGPLRDVVVFRSIPREASGVYDSAEVQRALDTLDRNNGEAIDESRAQEWVDQIYEPVQEQWKAAVRSRRREVTESVLAVNRPLESHEELADAFEQLFDGTEVVPASLEEKYRSFLREQPLRAPGIRIPVGAGQAAGLRRRGALRRSKLGKFAYQVAEVPYDTERGLDLGFKDAEP